MKKIIAVFILIVFILIFSLTGCNNDKDLTEVTLNQVVHSVFYAPQYVAIEKGFFEEEGLKVTLETGWGADKSMTALLSNNADIALMGPESSIYVYTEGQEDYAISFAQLTQRAGNFLVSAEPIQDFDWQDVKGKTIIGGRPGGMPQMVLEYILKQQNITPFTDVDIITNIDFTATAGSFANGDADFTVEFEPTATSLETEGIGTIVASLGVDSGKIPYTAYMCRKSYMEENPDIIQSFTNAIYKAQVWVDNNTPEEIAKVIEDHFPETDSESLVVIIDRYKSQDTWRVDPVFPEDGFTLLQNVLSEAGELESFVDYNELVTNQFAEEALTIQ